MIDLESTDQVVCKSIGHIVCNKDCFISSFLIHMPFIYHFYFCLMVLDRNSNIILKGKAENTRYGNYGCAVCWVVSDSLRPMDYSPPGSSCLGFSRQEYWVGHQSLLQGIFPTKGSNPGLLHCRQILYLLSHQGSPGDQITRPENWWDPGRESPLAKGSGSTRIRVGISDSKSSAVSSLSESLSLRCLKDRACGVWKGSGGRECAPSTCDLDKQDQAWQCVLVKIKTWILDLGSKSWAGLCLNPRCSSSLLSDFEKNSWILLNCGFPMCKWEL